MITEIFPKIVDAIIRFLQSKVNQMKTIIRENMDNIVGYVGFLGFISDIGQTILDGIERFFNSVFSRYKGEMMSKFLSKLGMIVSAILTAKDVLEDRKITVGELVVATLNIGMGYVGSYLGSMICSKAGLFIGVLLGGIGAPIGGAVGYILGGIIGGYLGGEFGAWLGSRISEHFGLENRVIVDFSTAAATS
ncbi:MAG: hypothetical protein NZM44_00440 [Candidatus Calescibacterium sp.]|nr:hypothetical protein [Candidatus Calescibacterium sp.]